MRFVILRDDDTSALTPIECLECLYRPFLDRGLPVNLALIPNVSTAATLPDGRPEGYLWDASPSPRAEPESVPIGSNRPLVDYLLENPGYHVVQHGFQHDRFEFERTDPDDLAFRLDWGSRLLAHAGFPKPAAFVAPHDRFTRASLAAVARRFPVISSGWYELRRVPYPWWPRYLRKRFSHADHWRANGNLLLTHPGCLLSHLRSRDTMLDQVQRAVRSRQLTVLVTHWWEYFPDRRPDHAFMTQLHRLADWLATSPDIQVISFSDLLRSGIPLN